jgi:hypothetical protein
LHEPEKTKAESDSQIEDLLYYQSMSAKWFGWLVSELAAFNKPNWSKEKKKWHNSQTST